MGERGRNRTFNLLIKIQRMKLQVEAHFDFAPPLHNNTIFDTNGNPVSTAGLIDTTARSH